MSSKRLRAEVYTSRYGIVHAICCDKFCTPCRSTGPVVEQKGIRNMRICEYGTWERLWMPTSWCMYGTKFCCIDHPTSAFVLSLIVLKIIRYNIYCWAVIVFVRESRTLQCHFRIDRHACGSGKFPFSYEQKPKAGFFCEGYGGKMALVGDSSLKSGRV